LVSVETLDDYDYRVILSGVPNPVEFRSIGGLNIYSQNFSWYRGEYSFVLPNTLAGELVNVSFNASAFSGLSYMDVVLNYGGVLKNTTRYTFSDFFYFNSSFVTPSYDANVSTNLSVTYWLPDLSGTSLVLNDTFNFSSVGVSGSWVDSGNLIDNNNGTGSAVVVGGVGYVYYNFSVNVNTSAVMLYSNDGLGLSGAVPVSCWNRSFLELRIYSSDGAFIDTTRYACYNGSDWDNLFSYYVAPVIKEPRVVFSGNTGYKVFNFNISSINYVVDFYLGDCGAISNVTSLYFENRAENDVLSLMSADWEIEVLYWITNKSNNRTWNRNTTDLSNFSWCLFPNGTYYVDVYIKDITDAWTNRYFEFNSSINETRRNITLYNFNSSNDVSELRLTVRDVVDYGYFKNVVVTLQRWYVGQGVWRNVQMDKTGDYGLSTFRVRERDTDYRLLYKDLENNVLKYTNNLKFGCNNDLCEITQLLSAYSVSVNDTFSSLVSYSNDTGLINISWVEASGDTVIVRYLVGRELSSGFVSMCDTSVSGVAGSYTCNLSGLSGVASVRIYVDGVLDGTNFITLADRGLGIYVGDSEGILWAVGIMITVVMFGLFSPVGAVISAVLGLIIIFLLGLVSALSITFIVVAAVIGIFIGMKVRT
jgi:hypothetical protein